MSTPQPDHQSDEESTHMESSNGRHPTPPDIPPPAEWHAAWARQDLELALQQVAERGETSTPEQTLLAAQTHASLTLAAQVAELTEVTRRNGNAISGISSALAEPAGLNGMRSVLSGLDDGTEVLADVADAIRQLSCEVRRAITELASDTVAGAGELSGIRLELADIRTGGINVGVVAGGCDGHGSLQTELANQRDEFEAEQAELRDEIRNLHDEITELRAIGTTGAALTGSAT